MSSNINKKIIVTIIVCIYSILPSSAQTNKINELLNTYNKNKQLYSNTAKDSLKATLLNDRKWYPKSFIDSLDYYLNKFNYVVLPTFILNPKTANYTKDSSIINCLEVDTSNLDIYGIILYKNELWFQLLHDYGYQINNWKFTDGKLFGDDFVHKQEFSNFINFPNEMLFFVRGFGATPWFLKNNQIYIYEYSTKLGETGKIYLADDYIRKTFTNKEIRTLYEDMKILYKW